MTGRRATLLTAGALLAVPAASRAQEAWPTRPMRIVVPFAAGGGTDVITRILADALGERLGQPVIVENRAGAGGNIGMENVVRATADGYTLLMGTTGTLATNRHLFRGMAFDPVQDFVPATLAFKTDHVLCIRAALPARDVAQLVALARARPGEITFGSAGAGSSTHMFAELFRLQTGIALQHVPYRGGALALNDLVAGRIDLLFDSLPSAVPQIRAGAVRALAICGPARHALLAEVPTMTEAGVPGYAVVAWGAIVAPRGTPAAVIARLERAMAELVALPEVQQRVARAGADAVASSARDLAELILEETDRWGRVVREAGITAN
jgi:tripartite-type tricarboxylate transporter receptor subunit TctC